MGEEEIELCTYDLKWNEPVCPAMACLTAAAVQYELCLWSRYEPGKGRLLRNQAQINQRSYKLQERREGMIFTTR